MLKHGKVVDINRVHVSLAHAHASVLQATARQHGFRLTGELVSSSARSMAKGNRAPTAHHTMARAKRSTELLHIDTAGLFPVSLGGSRYVVMFVNSAYCSSWNVEETTPVNEILVAHGGSVCEQALACIVPGT